MCYPFVFNIKLQFTFLKLNQNKFFIVKLCTIYNASKDVGSNASRWRYDLWQYAFLFFCLHSEFGEKHAHSTQELCCFRSAISNYAVTLVLLSYSGMTIRLFVNFLNCAFTATRSSRWLGRLLFWCSFIVFLSVVTLMLIESNRLVLENRFKVEKYEEIEKTSEKTKQRQLQKYNLLDGSDTVIDDCSIGRPRSKIVRFPLFQKLSINRNTIENRVHER